MLDNRKAAVWQALGLGPEWVLRQELIELKNNQPSQETVVSPSVTTATAATSTRAIPPAQKTGQPSTVSTPSSTPRQEAQAQMPTAGSSGTSTYPSSSATTSGNTRRVAPPASSRSSTTAAPRRVVKGRSAKPEAHSAARADRIKTLSWDELVKEITSCTMCEISSQRINAVPGQGTPPKDLVLIGEGPGAEEDRQGRPFCGPSGKLLDSILQAAGLNRETDVGIVNTIKCRPPLNADPSAAEMAACKPYLDRQLELMDPKVIVAMGKPAAKALFGSDATLTSRRQIIHKLKIAGKQRIVIVTYHPAALLRNPLDKKKAWQDWCLVLDTLGKVQNV